jgi:hypothetical protein
MFLKKKDKGKKDKNKDKKEVMPMKGKINTGPSKKFMAAFK